MVYNFNNAIRGAVEKIGGQTAAKSFGNPLMLVALLIVFYILVVFILVMNSTFKNRWKVFSIFGLVGIAAITGIVFLSESMRKKIKFSGGSTTKFYDPPVNYFNPNPIINPVNTNIGYNNFAAPNTNINQFDELFK